MFNPGNVYIADYMNHRIRKVAVSTGIITTIAGTGATTYNGDTIDATSAALRYPEEVAVDSSGMITVTICDCEIVFCAFGDSYLDYYVFISISNLGIVYIADTGHHRVRKISTSTGIISTIAGDGGTGYSGDNAAATSVSLYYPYEVALDASGMVMCFAHLMPLFLITIYSYFHVQ